MKRKTKKDNNVIVMMTKIQEQLAILDNKLDSFMTKSLSELAQAMAVVKQASVRPAPIPIQSNVKSNERPGRPMYAVICFKCGEDCEIPFKPSGNRPVYCKKCFANRKSYTPKPNTPRPPVSTASEPSRVVAPIISVTKSKAKKKTAPKKAATKKKTVAKKKASTKKKTTSKKKTPATKKKSRKR